MDFFSTAWTWFKGSSVSASLAKTALLGYASRLLNKSTGAVSTGSDEIVDRGVRLQLNPDTENKIPVLYGEAYFGGYITDAQLSSDYKKMTYCITLCEIVGTKLSDGQGTAYGFRGVYLNNNRVVFKSDGVTVDYTLDASGNQDISARGLIKIYVYGNQTGLAPTGISATIPDPWTVMPGWTQSTHPMTDLLYAIVEVTYNKDSGITGVPDCQFHIANNMTNVGDVLYDYMTNPTYGANIPSTEIDTTSLSTLNSFCSTGFTYTNLSNQSTTSTITVNGLVDTKTDVLTNMQALAEAGSSWMTYDIHTGTWRVVINRAGSSVASFNDSNIVGEISISGTSLTQLNNVADVKYQNTDIQDKTDFVKISIPTADLFANEPENSIQINLPFTNKQVVAAKIGLQQLKQARVDKIINFRADYSYILLSAGDIIDITSSVYGFTNKKFRIITITQSEGDAGEIYMDFTALEYDADVYAYNIAEYEVISDNGILGIGSIGKPNTPTVTKTEQANVPKIVINAVVPSGIVDAVEFWITFDTTVQNDSARNYIKVGQFANPSGAVLTEDATVSYTYTGLQQSDFYVKVRGINNVTTGPFSDPSGLIAYVPIVVADTVSDNPVSVGGQLMGLGLLTLLNNVDKLFSGDSSAGGLFDKMFETFKNVTGVDLVGQASGGTLVVAGSGLIDGLTDVDTSTVPPEIDNVLKWDGVNWVPGVVSSGTTPPTPTYLSIKELYPKDRSTYSSSLLSTEPDLASVTGDYYIKFNGINYGSLTKGTGNAKLYKSNGSLIETISASAATVERNMVKLPFGDREVGVDYYIIVDSGFVKYNTTPSPTISVGTWNFHTGTGATPAASGDPVISNTIPSTCTSTAVQVADIVTYSNYNDPSHVRVHRQSNIGIKFNEPVQLTGTGTVNIKTSSGGTHQTFNLSQTYTANKINELFWTSGSTLWINVTKDFTPGTTYYATLTANCVVDACGINKNQALTTANWTVDGGAAVTSASPTISGLTMSMDSQVKPGTGLITIADATNTTVATLGPKDPALSIREG